MPTVTMEIDLPASSTPVVQLYSVSSRVTGASYGSPVTGTAVSGVSTRYVFSLGTVAAGDYFGKITSPAGGFVLRVGAASWDEAATWTELDNRTLLEGGGVTISVANPVAATGQLTSIVIGDDYLSANSRAFVWTITAPTGYVAGTSTCYFGGDLEGDGWNITGTVADAGSGNWTLTFDMPKTATQDLVAGHYAWSVEVRSSSGTEITRVRSSKPVQLVEKQT